MNPTRLHLSLISLFLGLLSANGQGSDAYTALESVQEDGTEIGTYAPADAFENGSEFPFYGSENPLNWRQFEGEKLDRDFFRRSQRILIQVINNNLEQAIVEARYWMEQDPTDLEPWFMLALAYTANDQLDLALEAAREAVSKGIPIERFYAGPRHYLQPLLDDQAFKQWAEPITSPLIHGPLLGATTTHSIQVWMRTRNAAHVTVEVALSDKLSEWTVSPTVSSGAHSDYIVRIPLKNLKPNERYRYRVLIDGERVTPEPYPEFHTYPLPGSTQPIEIIFGGCSPYVPRNERMWDLIHSYHPHAFLTLGDNLYIDYWKDREEFIQYTFNRRRSRPEFRRLTAEVPIFAIWDDHDVGLDDSFLGPYPFRPTFKYTYWKHFRQNWNNPAYGMGDTLPGVWFSFAIGDVDIFMLDGRYYRTNPRGPNPTMLGPVQLAWLKQALKQSQARVKVIASPVAWNDGAKPGARDTWAGFPDERKELFDFMGEEDVTGVILLSSDRHRSEARRIDREKGYPLYDLSSGRLTHINASDLKPGAIFDYNEKPSFGRLLIDFSQLDPIITYEIRSIDDERIHALNFTLNDLQ